MSGVVTFFGKVRVEMLDRNDPEQVRSSSQRYRTLEDFAVRTGKYGLRIVKAGFVTDFASVPPAARVYFSNEHPAAGKAALVHDSEYTLQHLSREDADDLFRILLLAEGMRPSQAWLVHRMVRLFGASRYAKE